MTAGRRDGAPFSAGQANLVRTVSDFVGVAHTTAELHRQREEQLRERRELEIAAQIQRSLLATVFPDNPHWCVHDLCESARAVGADFFDVVAVDGGPILIIIADVMGKGIPAAMFSSLLRASARARLRSRQTPDGAQSSTRNRFRAFRDVHHRGRRLTGRGRFRLHDR
ncbi:MAG: SpoIIE family protein phosphatase [Candidatus Synoicihabitans palmerolidicus]|nr:SpoIIE family protein phosphatase [Candidatus Synoicihabitans palmerolidicus]